MITREVGSRMPKGQGWEALGMTPEGKGAGNDTYVTTHSKYFNTDFNIRSC